MPQARRSLGRAEVQVKRFSELGVVDFATGEVYRPERAPIERELKVVRVGPNPRMVLCEYWELESRRTCVVRVGNNRKWVKGMVFRMAEPEGELEFSKPWEYEGKQPRRRGRW